MICANDGCENEFTPKTHNQKYCSDECCRIATNIKIKQKYYDKKARLAGKQRVCANKECNNVLSRYNSSKICIKCEAKKDAEDRKHLLEMINNATKRP